MSQQAIHRARDALILILLATTLTLSLLLALAIHKQGAEPRLANLNASQLADEKTREEISKLFYDRGFLGSLPAYAAVLTVFGTALGVVVTARQQLEEKRQDREQRKASAKADLKQRARQLELDAEARRALERQQETEGLRRFDATMKIVIRDLTSADTTTQAGAMASVATWIQTLLREPIKATFRGPIIGFLTASMRIETLSSELRRMLTRAFESAIREALDGLEAKDRRVILDLTRCHLEYADLRGLDLRNADLAWARMSQVDLRGANLWRAQGLEAQLEGARLSGANLNEARFVKAAGSGALFNRANLVAARFENATLTKAEFFQSRLQSAHFRGANLRGARFESANVNDTFFVGADLDDQAIASLRKAKHWRKAHFDALVEEQLTQAADSH